MAVVHEWPSLLLVVDVKLHEHLQARTLFSTSAGASTDDTHRSKNRMQACPPGQHSRQGRSRANSCAQHEATQLGPEPVYAADRQEHPVVSTCRSQRAFLTQSSKPGCKIQGLRHSTAPGKEGRGCGAASQVVEGMAASAGGDWKGRVYPLAHHSLPKHAKVYMQRFVGVAGAACNLGFWCARSMRQPSSS